MPRALLLACLIAMAPATAARGAEVAGRISMPDACAAAVSPAVVVLEPAKGSGRRDAAGAATTVALEVGQRGLQFEPRVSVITRGRPLRFTNADPETHSVHVLAAGTVFNRSVGPGQRQEYTPTRPGVLQVVCDVHSHMRAFVVVADSPWAKACDREGRFRFRDVPAGAYTLKVWHEAGDGLKAAREVAVTGGAIDLGTIAVTGRATTIPLGAAGPARAWPEVIDRIGVLLASSLKAANRADGLKRARTLAQDAYFAEFEPSGMETAIGRVLGYERLRELEGQFKDFFGPQIGEIAAGTRDSAAGVALTRGLLRNLSKAAGDLNALGVIDAAHLGTAGHAPAATAAGPAQPRGDRKAQFAALDAGFGRVRDLADRGEAEEAGSAMASAYFDAFHPIEDELNILTPGVVVPLETRFNALRGRIGQGLMGADLGAALADLRGGVAGAVETMDAEATGGFTPAFLASLGIILREGVEIILLLGMLFALVAKVGQPGALRAIRWGVGLAVAASVATAVALNRMLAATQGRTRELMEGLVMLAATGVLFYVSYWLISKSESRRWMEFLKRQARRGAEVGGFGTLGLTAFLAVYREGAETALMYQAQVVIFGGSRLSLIGLGAGLAAGAALLAVLYRVLRSASVRLPIQTFFKVSGLMLFGMAVVFAGKGVAELQSCGLIRVTPLAWLGRGLPALGVYPNVQTISIQGLLMAGAALALALFALGGDPPAKVKSATASAVGAGA